MKIDIQTDDELTKLLNVLAIEIVDAQIYHKLCCDLEVSIAEYEREIHHSNTFWSLTLESLHEASLIRLCRVLDQNAAGLNLVNFLETIKANLHFFQPEHFRDRLLNNALVNSLALIDRIPPAGQLDQDIEFASSRNPLVKKLMIWRNKIVAHRDARVSLGKTQILEDNPLSQTEIEALLEKSFEMFNKYSCLYRENTWSRNVIGHQDYKALLDLLRLGLEKSDADSEVGHRDCPARARSHRCVTLTAGN